MSSNAESIPGVPTKASERWKRATHVTSTYVGICKQFRTLRDMRDDLIIDPQELQFVKKIGEGAFATVGLSTYQGRAVAVKYLKPSLLNSERDLDDFLKEAALLKKLSHPSIVDFVGVSVEVNQKVTESSSFRGGTSLSTKITNSVKALMHLRDPQKPMGTSSIPEEALDANQPPEQPDEESLEDLYQNLKNIMLVQEFMTRGNLKGMVLKQMRFALRRIYSREQALEWLIQIAQGLRYLHQARPMVVHRDLKMENVMLTLDHNEQVVAKLGDFGLHAVLKEPKHTIVTTENEEATMATSSIVRKETLKASVKACYELSGKTGSLIYMAPEVLRCQPYNEKADVFSFALIMYELFMKTCLLCFVSCTGEPGEIEQYANNVARGARPAVPEDWPEDIKGLVQKCWSQEPAERPAMTEIIDSLKKMRELDWIFEDQKQTGCIPCLTR